MPNLIKRFLSFDTLLGVGLARIIYYFGLVAICGGIVLGFLGTIMSLAAGNVSGAIMQVLAIPAVGLVAIVLWRFVCEVFIVLFEMNDRLGDLRNAVYGPPRPDPNAPQF